jgi:hypothetical protein
MAALARHREGRPRGADDPTRRARAAAQVWAILGDRLRTELEGASHGAATEAVLQDVAEHRLDPFAAADRLLASLRAAK